MPRTAKPQRAAQRRRSSLSLSAATGSPGAAASAMAPHLTSRSRRGTTLCLSPSSSAALTKPNQTQTERNASMAATAPGRWWMGRTRGGWAPRGSESTKQWGASDRPAGFPGWLASTCGCGFRRGKAGNRPGAVRSVTLRLRGRYGLAQWAHVRATPLSLCTRAEGV